MGIWLARMISLNHKLDILVGSYGDVPGFWQCKAVGSPKTNGAFKSDFSAQPTRTHRSAEASIGERTTDATPRAASKPPP